MTPGLGYQCTGVQNPSSLATCEKIRKVQEPLDTTIAELLNPVECLTTEEWQAWKEITVVPKLFDAVTTNIGVVLSVTASKTTKVVMTKLLEGKQKCFGGLVCHAGTSSSKRTG